MRARIAEQVGRQVSDRAKASEMEHAIRHHIKKKLDEAPVHYQKLSERVEEILNKFGDSWEQLALAKRRSSSNCGQLMTKPSFGLA